MSHRSTVLDLIAAINASDLEALHAVFTDDVVLEWPQSNERIAGNDTRRQLYEQFPSLPTVTPKRHLGAGDLEILEADLDYGDGEVFQCVFIFEMRDGKIAKETAYWAKRFDAPDWRKPWVEPIDR